MLVKINKQHNGEDSSSQLSKWFSSTSNKGPHIF